MITVFKGSVLIDGKGGPPQQDAAVIIEGDRIRWAGPNSKVVIPPGAKVFETDGRTIMPGMIDTHIHLCGPTQLPSARGGPFKDLIPFLSIRGVLAAKAMLEAGFTTCRDVGSIGYADIALKRAIEEGLVAGPRLLVSGEMVMSVGSGEHGYLRPEIEFPCRGAFCGVDWARRAVRTQLYHGADFIKLIASGRVGSDAFSMPWDTEMTREEMAAVVDEAHRWGKRVAAHAYSSETVRDCVLAGVDSIEHGTMIDEETIVLMAEHGTYLVPTLTPYHIYLKSEAEEYFPAYRVERGRPMAKIQLENFPKYLEHGLKIAVGSDSVTPGRPAGMTALELELMVDAGMTPMEAIQAATSIGAEVLGLEDRLGTLEPGKLADLLMIDGDPSKDIRILQDNHRILMVMKGGNIAYSSLSNTENANAQIIRLLKG